MKNSQSLGTVHTHTHTHTYNLQKRKEEAYLTSSFCSGAKEEVESN